MPCCWRGRLSLAGLLYLPHPVVTGGALSLAGGSAGHLADGTACTGCGCLSSPGRASKQGLLRPLRPLPPSSWLHKEAQNLSWPLRVLPQDLASIQELHLPKKQTTFGSPLAGPGIHPGAAAAAGGAGRAGQAQRGAAAEVGSTARSSLVHNFVFNILRLERVCLGACAGQGDVPQGECWPPAVAPAVCSLTCCSELPFFTVPAV